MRTIANYLGITATWFCIALVGFAAIFDAFRTGLTFDAFASAAISAVIGTLIYLVWGVEDGGRKP